LSRHSANKDAAIDFVLYLTGAVEQKRRALVGSFAPTIESLYQDTEVLAANPFLPISARSTGRRLPAPRR
jgi:trehalose/maltose transport system substrate-binding protein